MVKDRQGEGDSVLFGLFQEDRKNKPRSFFNGVRVREERGGMAIVAHPEQNEIETGRPFASEEKSKLRLVALCLLFRVFFPANPVDIRGRDRSLRKEKIPRPLKIALLPFRRHTAFIRPEKVSPIPVDLVLEKGRSKEGIESPGGLPTREGYGKPPTAADGLSGDSGKDNPPFVAESFQVGKDPCFDLWLSSQNRSSLRRQVVR